MTFLLKRKNQFRALALGVDRTESEAVERAIEYAVSDQRVRLHVLVVGINSYRNAVLNLSFAVPDAQGVAKFFRNNFGHLFKRSMSMKYTISMRRRRIFACV
ncbi:hypothetical protein [Propionivibrio sp.]|uniref:hypothetical protein n=1 Tax=Propionivibrio sp. TaxID=2212460 RepID=UPI0025F7C0F2|nr:hypothetical protein [Propionivibrio sp.]